MHEKQGAAIPGSNLKGSHWSLDRTEEPCGSPLSLAENLAVPGWQGCRACVSLAVGARGKGLQPPPLPRRVTSGTCSDLREEEGLKTKFSLCSSVGNGGVSFSHLDLTF